MVSDSGSIDVNARPRDSGACSLCRDGLSGETRECPDCGAGYHAACLRELGSRCATFGCGQQLDVSGPRSAAATATPLDVHPSPTPPTSAAMTPRQRVGVGVVLTLMGIVGIAGQVWITVNDSWADPKPAWWQLAFSFAAFGLAQIGLGIYAMLSGVRQLRNEGGGAPRSVGADGGSARGTVARDRGSPGGERGPSVGLGQLEDLPGEVWRPSQDEAS